LATIWSAAKEDETCSAALTNAGLPDALREVIGSYGLVVICVDCPGVIIGARRGSPLIIGVGENQIFSPATPTLGRHTVK